MNFQEFKDYRYNMVPWDRDYNPVGYGFERHQNKGYVLSDISSHLPFLEFVAGEVSNIVEMGVRGCASTSAFIQGINSRKKSSVRPKVVGYDIDKTSHVDDLLRWSAEGSLPNNTEFIYVNHSTVDPALDIAPTELLFIDTLHYYDQLKAELTLHGNKASKYILFHDTWSDWYSSTDVLGQEGLGRAIEEFLEDNPHWKIKYQVNFNHGLTLMERS